MFRRHSPQGSWLYPLLGSLAVFVFVAIAAYVLTSMWRERTAEMTGEEDETETDAPASPPATLLELTPIEILDRRLAAGEITIEQYDELTTVLNRRFTASTWSTPEQAAAA